MTDQNKEIATVADAELAETAAEYAFAASYNLNTEAGRMAAFNAGVACDEKLADHAGETLNMVAWLVEPIEVADQLTGELETRPHVVITDDAGKTYEAQSIGLYQALRRLQAIRPVIDQDNPAVIEIVSRKVARGKMITFKLVG